jgi:hypothetical protein
MNEKQIEKWCRNNSWTGLLYLEEEDKYYAFPPGAVIPIPVPINKDSDNLVTKIRKYKGFFIYGFLRGCLKSHQLCQTSKHDPNHGDLNHSFRSGW